MAFGRITLKSGDYNSVFRSSPFFAVQLACIAAFFLKFHAMKVISQLWKEIPNMMVGAGGVMDEVSARQSLDAGAQFLTSDGLPLDLIEFAAQQTCWHFREH
jgi:KDPG and KHG aldolase